MRLNGDFVARAGLGSRAGLLEQILAKPGWPGLLHLDDPLALYNGGKVDVIKERSEG